MPVTPLGVGVERLETSDRRRDLPPLEHPRTLTAAADGTELPSP